MTFCESVAAQLSELLEERYQIIDSAQEFTLRSISKGIVFIFAPWSGSSVKALRAVVAMLGKQEYHQCVLYIVNNDTLTQSFMTEEIGGPTNGDGETFWILNGEIVGKMTKYDFAASLELQQHPGRLSCTRE